MFHQLINKLVLVDSADFFPGILHFQAVWSVGSLTNSIQQLISTSKHECHTGIGQYQGLGQTIGDPPPLLTHAILQPVVPPKQMKRVVSLTTSNHLRNTQRQWSFQRYHPKQCLQAPIVYKHQEHLIGISNRYVPTIDPNLLDSSLTPGAHPTIFVLESLVGRCCAQFITSVSLSSLQQLLMIHHYPIIMIYPDIDYRCIGMIHLWLSVAWAKLTGWRGFN